MLEMIKKNVSRMTVIIALVLAVLCFVSLYFSWFTLKDESMSVMEAVSEAPDYFVGLLPGILISLACVVCFFVLNHPKLTLVGDLVLLFMGAALIFAGTDRNLGIGFGCYFYFLTVIGLIVCAFATKKIKKNRPADAK